MDCAKTSHLATAKSVETGGKAETRATFPQTYIYIQRYGELPGNTLQRALLCTTRPIRKVYSLR